MINIYAIYAGEQCLYIGSTSRDVNTRYAEHLQTLTKGKHSNKSLQKTFDKVNGNVEFRLISTIDTDNTLLRFFYENLHNSLLKPKCCKAIIQQGRNKIILQRTSEEIAEELIRVIDDIID